MFFLFFFSTSDSLHCNPQLKSSILFQSEASKCKLTALVYMDKLVAKAVSIFKTKISRKVFVAEFESYDTIKPVRPALLFGIFNYSVGYSGSHGLPDGNFGCSFYRTGKSSFRRFSSCNDSNSHFSVFAFFSGKKML